MGFESSTEQSIFIPGPEGPLEALVSRAVSSNLKQRVVGIMCHPHPLYQGTMHNKVVTTVIRAWQHLGLDTVRFNFRGVGNSAGTYAEGVGELEDARTVLQWALNQFPKTKVCLAGFSFGAFIATKLADSQPLLGLLSIAPALSLFDFFELKNPQCPWLIIHGGNDEIVPVEKVNNWHQFLTQSKPANPVELVILPQASHFFHGCLDQLRANIEAFMKALL